jgi:hypothetical protein
MKKCEDGSMRVNLGTDEGACNEASSGSRTQG